MRVALGSPRRRALTAMATGVLTALAVASGPATAVFNATTSSQLTTLKSGTYTCLSRSPADSPYFYWAYNEASGSTFTDSSGNGRTGTLVSGARSTGSCAANASSVFTLTATTGSAVSAASSAPPADITLETWFKTAANGTTGGGRMIGYGDSASGSSATYDRTLYMDNAGHVCFYMKFSPGNPISICTSGTYNDGAWHLADVSIVGGSNQGARALYIDGGSPLAGATNRTAYTYSGYWRVGTDSIADLQSAGTTLGSANAGPTNSGWPGTLDNTAVYSAILTQAQVTAHFNNTKNAR